MDDQNQTNQPASIGFPPIVPSVPEDITPSDTPVTTTTTTTVTSPQPISAPVAPPLPPVEVAPVAMPPMPTAEPFAMPTSAPIEPEMPANKPKNKLLPIIGGIAALLLVVGVAGASYYVSNQLSTRQAVAPNAPESKPAASSCGKNSDCASNLCIRGICAGAPLPTATPTQSAVAQIGKTPTPTPTTARVPSPSAQTTQATTPTPTPPTAAATNNSCTSAGGGCFTGRNCADLGKTAVNGTSGCSNTSQVCCSLGTAVTTISCTAAGGGCYKGANCAQLGRLAINGTSGCTDITYVCCSTTSTGTTTTSTGTTTTTTATNTAADEYCPGTGTCVYGYAGGNCHEDQCGMGAGTYCKAQANGICCRPIAECGGGPTASPTASPTVTPVVGACMNIKIYKKVGDVYQTTPLTTTELQNLKVGDILKLGITSSADNLKGRFRVTVSGTAGAWISGSIEATNKKMVTYSDYTIEMPGTYSFEAQVTTVP